MKERIAVVGLGYVGLPLAVALAKKFEGVVGFDINEHKIQELKNGIDRTNELHEGDLERTTLNITCDPQALCNATFIIVAVPTPIDEFNNPDLSPIEGASRTIGKSLSAGAVVVYESTVWPGVTDDICGPILEKTSGLVRGKDFKLGYSPERINPGDKVHTLETITKIVSGEDEETLARVIAVYSQIVEAGLHPASSIKVAEAAKVIENTQRDINIAIMNELARIFELLDIPTHDILEAAGTKWNFLKFNPGLVGGHCISVDPYYLTTIAQKHGYTPHLILAARRINDGISAFIAEKVVKLLIKADKKVKNAKVAILGLTFKENVPDLRNSKVPDIIKALKEYGIDAIVHDKIANAAEAHHEYGIELAPESELHDLDAVVVAVAHDEYRQTDPAVVEKLLAPGGVIVDVKAILNHKALKPDTLYWSL